MAAEIDKGMFTGGVEAGRAVLGNLGRRGMPAVAELSGFDPAIVLADAPLEPTARALAWGAFVGCGQTCVAVKRVYVVGDPGPWAEAIAAVARRLRIGDPGPRRGRPRADDLRRRPRPVRPTIAAAVAAGARVRPAASHAAGRRLVLPADRPARGRPRARAGPGRRLRPGRAGPRRRRPSTRRSPPPTPAPTAWPRASGAATAAPPGPWPTGSSRHGVGQRGGRSHVGMPRSPSAA